MKKILLSFMLLVCAVLTNAATPTTYNIEGRVITYADYDEETSSWEIRFKNDDWKITLNLKSDNGEFRGSYTIDDAAVENTCFATDISGEDQDRAFTEMSLTITAREDVTNPKDGCEITGTAKDADGNTYKFHMLKNPPIIPTKTVNVDVNVSVSEWPSTRNGGSYYELTEVSNPQNKWILSLYYLTGEATDKDGIDTATCCINTDTETRLNFDNGKITQTLNGQDQKIMVEAALVMADSVQYKFNFSVAVDVKGEQTLNYTDLMVDYSTSEYGYTSLSASTEDTQMNCDLTDYASIPDTYTDQNCNPSLEIYKDGEQTHVNKLSLVSASSELAADQTPVFKAKFLGDDKILYTVNASYVKPAIADTMHITLTEGVELYDATSYESGFSFSYSNDTTAIWIGSDSNQIEGQHTGDDVKSGSYIAYMTQSGMMRNVYVTDANFNITRDGKVYTLAGTCQAGSHFVYLTMKYTMQGIDDDDYNEDVEGLTFTKDDVVSKKANEDGQYVCLDLVNSSRGDELTLIFFPENFRGSTIPAGEYEISDASWPGTVLAGDHTDDGYTPSFYVKLDNEGNPQSPFWFLRSGKVVVDSKGNFEVNAKNSYNRTIQATYTNATGISNINTDVDARDGKFLVGGKIVIRKSGVEYNTLGQRK